LDIQEMTMVAVTEMTLVQPMVAMMGLTALVWLFMYVRRLGYMSRHGVDAQSVNTPQKMAASLPEAVEFASNNLKNLFELPVLFYALCLLLMQQGWVTPLELGAAWAFVALRAVHSLVHCTVNIVAARFAAYVLASAALWVMLARVVWRVWG
jgi:hypothetical protein